MVVKNLGLIVLLAVSAACASTPEEPPVLTNIAVSPLEQGRLKGGRAHYTIDAPPAVVKKVILDFESQAEFRPMVKEARLLNRTEEGGEVYFRFRGMVGITPEADCVYAVEEDGDVWRLSYKMTSSSFALWALNGSFELVPQDGGRKTFVRQQFLVSAIIMDHAKQLEELKVDAASIRDRAEEVAAGGDGPG